jgi:hypothetical protein
LAARPDGYAFYMDIDRKRVAIGRGKGLC